MYRNMYVFYDKTMEKGLKKGERIRDVIIERFQDIIGLGATE